MVVARDARTRNHLKKLLEGGYNVEVRNPSTEYRSIEGTFGHYSHGHDASEFHFVVFDIKAGRHEKKDLLLAEEIYLLENYLCMVLLVENKLDAPDSEVFDQEDSAVLHKPVDTQEILSAIERLLRPVCKK
jgi:hypothetical protein